MKWYARQHTDGSLKTLERLLNEGLSVINLPLSLIRKYCRLQQAYLLAYKNNHDIVSAESWIKKRRSHRACVPAMDDDLDKLYFPQFYVEGAAAAVTEAVDTSETPVDNSENPEDALTDLNPDDIVNSGIVHTVADERWVNLTDDTADETAEATAEERDIEGQLARGENVYEEEDDDEDDEQDCVEEADGGAEESKGP
jgi:hypothetical protein